MSPGKVLAALTLATLAACSRSAPEDVSPGTETMAAPATTAVPLDSAVPEPVITAPAVIEPEKVVMSYFEQEQTIAPGATAIFRITVSNNSAAVLKSGITYVSYHWLGEDQGIVAWENPRTPVLINIGAGEKAAVSFPVVAPPQAGDYFLKVVMGQQDGLDFEAGGQPGLHYKVSVH